MSQNKPIFESGEYYHVYNRSIQKIPIFELKSNCEHFLKTATYYLQNNPPVKFSTYCENESKITINLNDRIVTTLCFCLMPTHFHFILRQEKQNGIQKFIQKLTNSFSHYHNTKYSNKGPLFESSYCAVHVESDRQLLHLSRYIHLNPVTSFLVNKPEDYIYSSYNHYINNMNLNFIDSSEIIGQFKTIEEYAKFVNDRIDYQRELAEIKNSLKIVD